MTGTQVDRTGPDRVAGAIEAVLAAPFDEQTYRNLAYLLVQFPLGVASLTLLAVAGGPAVAGGFVLVEAVPEVLTVTGSGGDLFVTLVALVVLVPLGVGLVVTGLAGASVAGVALLTVDRTLSAAVLGTTFPRRTSPVPFRPSPRAYVRAFFLDAGTYLALVIVLAKFVVGVVTFTLAIVATTVPGAFLAAPLLYDAPGVSMRIGVGGLGPIGGVPVGAWTVDTLPEAVLLSGVGVLTLLCACCLVNVLAKGLEAATRTVYRHARVFDSGA